MTSWIAVAFPNTYFTELLSCGEKLEMSYMYPSRSLQGRLQSLDYNDVQYLLCLVQENHNYFPNELLHLLKTNHFISVHYTTIYHELKWHQVSLKKLERGLPRNAVKRSELTLLGEWLSIVSRKLASLTKLQRMRRPFVGDMFGKVFTWYQHCPLSICQGSHQVPSTIFSRSQSHWRSILKNKVLGSSALGVLQYSRVR